MIVPIKGELVRRCGTELYRVRPGQALFSPPDEAVNILWGSYCTGISIWIEKKPFDMMLGSFFGATNAADLTYVPTVDLTKGAGLSIAEALRSIIVEIRDRESLFSRGITTKQHEELLITAMMQSAVTLREGAARRISRKRDSTRLNRALGFIHGHLHEEIKIDDVSAAAGVSIRTLQYEFARHLGVGPMSLVRREKLDEVRQELLHSRVGETTVADVAALWGFYDPKYFSKIYLREFHERPSYTLARTD
jgi:AraC-like DNA-binding protein